MQKMVKLNTVYAEAVETHRAQYFDGFVEMMNGLDADFPDQDEFGWNSLCNAGALRNAFHEYVDEIEAERRLFDKLRIADATSPQLEYA
jgi:hypothetical protein